MALLWLDSFDSYGTTNGSAPSPSGVVARRYATVNAESSIDIEGPIYEGRSLQHAATTTYIVTPALTTNTTLIAGCRVYNIDIQMLQTGISNPIMSFMESSNRSLTLYLMSGTLAVFKGVNATLIGKAVRYQSGPNGWSYIEMKAKCDNSAGTVEVRVNGTTVMSFTGQDTQNAAQGYYDSVRFGSSGQAGIVMEDFYIADASGNTNNDFLGPIIVQTIRPTSDVVTTVNAGGYADVDEAVADDDTTTVVYSGAGENLEMGFPNSNNFAAIKGLSVSGMFKTDANTTYRISANSLNTVVNSGNGNYNSANYTTKSVIFELDSGNNAWTPNTVNAASFGFEVP